MVTAIRLEEIKLQATTVEALDQVVASGRFPSRDEAIRCALYLVQENDAADDEPLTPEEIAGIERGLADVAAGRGIPIEEVRAEMERRHAAGL